MSLHLGASMESKGIAGSQMRRNEHGVQRNSVLPSYTTSPLVSARSDFIALTLAAVVAGTTSPNVAATPVFCKATETHKRLTFVFLFSTHRCEASAVNANHREFSVSFDSCPICLCHEAMVRYE